MTLTPNPVLYEYVVFALFKNYSPKSWQSKVKKKKKKEIIPTNMHQKL